MRNSMDKSRITITEVIFLLIGMLLIFALARIATGQSAAPGAKTLQAGAQIQQPLYREYRGDRGESETRRAGFEER